MTTAATPAAAAGELDPALSEKKHETITASSQPYNVHDKSISFEEFRYWADITRGDELNANKAFQDAKTGGTLKERRVAKKDALKMQTSTAPHSDEEIITGVSEQEWKQASRAMRTASWGSCFFLITTDILGPFSTPWSFAQTGYGPGIALYTVFGAMAGYSAWIMWKTFLGLDSDRYPLRTYGDIFFRLFGPVSRHIVNIMLAVQMVLFVSTLILSQGQSISQISQGDNGSNGNGICFVACLVIFMAASMVVGQIKSFRRFSWLASSAVVMNLTIIFLCMGVVVHYPPNFKATEASFGKDFGPGPIQTFAGQPPAGLTSGGQGFVASLNGLNQAVYSYGGCMVFVSFMAEMRHPWDFWKAILLAESFIYAVYMFFGIYVYSFQGQYTFNPVMQGLSPYNFQTAGNVLYVLVGLIAAALYGNIGFKVIYVEVFQEIFGFPPLTKRKGQVAWIVSIPVYFAIAFVIAAAVPQFSYISGLIGAFFILSFTYTLPAAMAVGYWIKKDAMLPGEVFDPRTRTYSYQDSGLKRLSRGFMKKPFFHLFNIIYALGGLATTGLGVYSSIVGLIDAFSGKSAATSFGCTPPV